MQLKLGLPVKYFSVSKELENENEDLKAKIRALEEQCVQLRNKRVNDVSELISLKILDILKFFSFFF